MKTKNIPPDIKSKSINEAKLEISDILKRDLWWDAKTCLKYGLVDDIIIPWVKKQY